MQINDIITDDNRVMWDIVSLIPEFSCLKDVKQPIEWHEEGSVWYHTQNVTTLMENIINGDYDIYANLGISREDISPKALITAALCHDLGKATTTYWDENLNTWKTKNHGAESERITRGLFIDENDIFLREKVCWLVRNHMALHHIFDNTEKIPERISRIKNGHGNIYELALLYYTDSMGSINPITKNGDTQTKETIKRLFTVLNEDKQKPTVYVMVGIAGSGKSTWIKQNLPNVTCISRDIIREELGFVKPGEKAKLDREKEDAVTSSFMNKCYECLSHGNDIVLDNMHLSKRYRDNYHHMFSAFKPKYTYVYVEAPSLSSNKERRPGQINEKEIDRMFSSLEFPQPNEYDELIVYKQK